MPSYARGGAIWNEANVEQLKKLWAEGKSATECAAILGQDISRNAVVSKVHRLKLPQRATIRTSRAVPDPVDRARQVTTRAHVDRAKSAATAREAVKRIVATRDQANENNGLAFKMAQARKVGLDLQEAMETVLGRQAAPDLTGPLGTPRPGDVVRVTLVQLNEHTCKWPIGDPREAGFGFCGAKPIAGKPYCERHAMRARGTIRESKADRELYEEVRRKSPPTMVFGGA